MSTAATYVNNTAISIAASTSIVEESCYFGPGSAVEVNAELIVYSKYVWIAPTATFTGTGKIIFRNPELQGGASSATLIDGNNGAFIPVTIDHDNGAGMVLSNLEVDVAANPATTFTMPSPSITATGDLKIGASFNMVSITQADPFDGGEVVLNGNNFVFDQDATIHGFRNSRFVDTGNSISGHIIKTFGPEPNNVFVFPVGYKPSNYEYTPVRITATSGTFYVSVQDFEQSISDESVLEGEQNVSRTWHIYADSEIEAKVETQHQAGLEQNGWDSTLPFIVSRWMGGTRWELNSESLGDFGSLSDQVPGPNNNNIQTVFEGGTLQDLTYIVPSSPTSTLAYSTHTYRENTALPVTLISFSAVTEGGSAQLSWQTSSEANSASFEVQRSPDAKRWTGIGSVAAYGQSTKVVNYAFTDNQPISGINYYRLKMLDQDATFAYSTIRNARFTESGSDIFTYPNPANGIIKLSDRNLSKIKSVEIIDLRGKVVGLFDSLPERGIDVQRFENGAYALRISYGDGSNFTHKIVISK